MMMKNRLRLVRSHLTIYGAETRRGIRSVLPVALLHSVIDRERVAVPHDDVEGFYYAAAEDIVFTGFIYLLLLFFFFF